jgi:glutamyl-tRNA reductase
MSESEKLIPSEELAEKAEQIENTIDAAKEILSEETSELVKEHIEKEAHIQAQEVLDKVERKVESTKEAALRKVEDVKEDVEEKIEEVKDKVEDKVENVKEKHRPIWNAFIHLFDCFKNEDAAEIEVEEDEKEPLSVKA